MILNLIRKNLSDPLYYRAKGSVLYEYWKELEHSQYLPERELKDRQWQRLTDLLHYVYQNNSFYRKRFEENDLLPQNIKSPEDLPRIPLLTKNDIRQNIDLIISKGFKKENLLEFKTGGSTGKSLRFYITEECSEKRNACARRHDRWTGWEPGEPIAACWGNPLLPIKIKDRLKNKLLQPMFYLDTMQVDDHSVRAFVKEWKKSKPTLLYGHAHSLFILVEYLKKLGISGLSPKGILSTSMMLIPSERKVIEDYFGIKVTDRYGCEEVSLIASECEKHEGMHLNIEHLFIEFIKDDGSACLPGEPGQIIVTDLLNYAMPFIRYQIEDYGTPSDKICQCERKLPLMKNVVGRTADFLIKEDGTRVAGVSIIENTLTKFPGIEQMQIIQENMNFIILSIVPGSQFDKNVEEKLINYFNDLFGENAEINIKLVDFIKPEKSGKYRFTICKI